MIGEERISKSGEKRRKGDLDERRIEGKEKEGRSEEKRDKLIVNFENEAGKRRENY